MNRKIICIVIALLVLSISAIIGAKEISLILGRFSSTLNGVPVQVKMFRQGKGTITTMRTEDLVENLADYDGRFVRFTGRVENNSSPIFIGPVRDRKLTLEGPPLIEVYPLDAPNLPAIYHEGDEYEFTGFLMRYESHAEFKKSGYAKMRVYAFEIRHLREAE